MVLQELCEALDRVSRWAEKQPEDAVRNQAMAGLASVRENLDTAAAVITMMDNIQQGGDCA
jgi:hypothetical protein